ncbi:MAG: hypothetical protein II897_09420 [Clostridia bacterium]|nr:hypothetical protein [Clostridia bacterium]
MKTLFQAIRDLFRELGFVLLYGLLAAIVLSSFINSVSGIKRILSTAKYVSQFKNGSVDMVILEGMGSYKNVEPSEREDAVPIDAFLREGLSKDGRLGGSAVVRNGGADGFDNVIIVVGRMVDIALDGVPEDRQVYAAVSHDLSAMIGTSAKINGNEFPIEAAVPKDITVGTLYNRTQSTDTKRALFLFVRDYESASAKLGISPQQFLMKLVVVGADEEYKSELIGRISGATGMHTRIWSADDYLQLTGDSGTKYLKLKLAFYAAASFALIAAMIMNLSRIIDAHENDYRVNRLFGATKAQTFLRMLWLAIGFNMIPAIYIVIKVMLPLGWVSRDDRPGEFVRAIVPYSPEKAAVMAAGLAVLFGTAAAVAVIEFLGFERKYSKEIGRR